MSRTALEVGCWVHAPLQAEERYAVCICSCACLGSGVGVGEKGNGALRRETTPPGLSYYT